MLGDYARVPREYFPRPAQSHPDWKRQRREEEQHEEQRRGTEPIMRVARVEFVTVLHCSPTQTGTRWMRLMGEIFGQTGVMAAFVPGFRVFQTLPLPIRPSPPARWFLRFIHVPLLVNYLLVFPHPRFFLCARSLNVRARDWRTRRTIGGGSLSTSVSFIASIRDRFRSTFLEETARINLTTAILSSEWRTTLLSINSNRK